MNEFVLFVAMVTGAFDRPVIIEMPMDKAACVQAEGQWRKAILNTFVSNQIFVWCYRKHDGEGSAK